MRVEWVRVTKQEPCKICAHGDWCTRSDRGACCMRIQSSIPLKNGGWLHLSDEKKKEIVRSAPPPEPTIDAAGMISDWDRQTNPIQLSDFASSLGVTYDSLRNLQCCRSKSHHAWAFPMRDGASQIIGIRLRYDDGQKRAVKGSRSGIFIPMIPSQHTCWIAEGPTDCAALLSIGLFSIGRPSCSGGNHQLWIALKERRIRKAVIVSDNDQDKHRPDGERYNPGVDGANRLADEMCVETCVIIPPAKDIREYVTLGGTSELLESIVSSTVWNKPKSDY